MDRHSEITLEKFLYVVRKRLILIIAIGVACAVLAGVLSVLLITPEYSSTVKLYVNTTQDQKTYITQSDITVAKSLVSTYIVVIKSDSFLEQVAEKAGVSYSPEKVRSELTAGAISNTEAFSVTVTDRDKNVAFSIAQAIADLAPDEIVRVVEAGSVKIIDPPKLAKDHNDIGTTRNVVLGFIAGFIISFAIFFFAEVMDVTIYSEEDLEGKFGYPIIGTIPSIVVENPSEKIKKRKKKASKKKSASENNTAKEEN